MDENEKQYIYIIQASLEPSKCKIGKTNDLDRRLKEYNNMTGKSKENIYQYLFTCEVVDMSAVENAIKDEFSFLREVKSKEIYFYNPELLNKYVKFIKSHPLFIKEIFIKKEEKKQEIKIVKKTTPSLEERGLSQKDLLQNAQKAKNDEFYTRYEDVEKEIEMYDKNIWEDKCVFCNCDDAVDTDERKSSAFSLYFMRNFRELGLRKLICTHYGGGIDLFNQGAKGYVYTYIFTKNGFKELKEYPKGYTGSFDDPLSLKILNEEADIVCTNPPFSKTIEYWQILIESGKKFLVISNIANITRPTFITYFINEQVWAGYNRVDYYFNPKRQLVDASGHWYTNIPINDRPKRKHLKIMPLKDIPEKHKKYDDSKILMVDDCYIPSDYKKTFAVSVRPILNGLLEKGYKIIQDKEYYPYINGKKKFARVLVQKI
ncbi:MAG: GIY-YIG nuclease family protein [Ignavibacteria bacterium]|jgi:predicted GIY-YIG superfamily endonuclease|nr:GIY-YIG nuclease family protein [Ignavibacteria bacterium]